MAETKKLSYKEVPRALRYVVVTLWRISPGYVLASLASSLIDRLVPFVSIFIVAAITSQLPELITTRQNVLFAIGLLVLLLVVQSVQQVLDIFIRNYQRRKEAYVSIKLRQDFYLAYARLPYYLYEDKEVIDAFQYADDFMYRFNRFGVLQITNAVGSFVEIIIAIVALGAVAWYMPLLFVLFLPLLIRSIIKLNREQAKVYFHNRPANRLLWAIEGMFYPRNIKETRLYGIVEHMLGRRRSLMQKISDQDVAIELKRNRLGFWQDIQLELVGFIAASIAVVNIAYLGAPLGIFVLAQQLTSRAGGSLRSLFGELSSFDQDLYGFAEYRYISETLQDPNREQLPTAPSSPSIHFDHVSFHYPHSETTVLKSANFTIPYGHNVAIVGENGAGKTTLMRLLLGLYRPNKGQVLIDDIGLSAIDEASWLQRVGVLLQDFGMNQDMTLRDAVWLGDITKPSDDVAIYEALKQVELDTHIKKLPHGLDTYLGKWVEEDKGTELSGGQLQRLAIARALFRSPNILVLDEPTSSIDANAEERIFQTLMENRRGKTTIFISHRFSTVRRAERILCIDNGQVIEDGTHQELMRLKGKYYQMFTTQAKGYR